MLRAGMQVLLMVSTLSTSLMLQVISRAAVTNSATDSSEMPDCRGLGNSAVLGHLPQVLPASLMHHQAFQQLQMQLLPFQVIIV